MYFRNMFLVSILPWVVDCLPVKEGNHYQDIIKEEKKNCILGKVWDTLKKKGPAL